MVFTLTPHNPASPQRPELLCCQDLRGKIKKMALVWINTVIYMTLNHCLNVEQCVFVLLKATVRLCSCPAVCADWLRACGYQETSQLRDPKRCWSCCWVNQPHNTSRTQESELKGAKTDTAYEIIQYKCISGQRSKQLLGVLTHNNIWSSVQSMWLTCYFAGMCRGETL